jgi:hypothetical protein
LKKPSKKEQIEVLQHWTDTVSKSRVARFLAILVAGQKWVDNIERNLNDNFDKKILLGFRKSSK